MSHHFILNGDVIYDNYTISLYGETSSSLNIDQIQIYLDNLEIGLNPREITESLILNNQEILKVDISQGQDIILITETNPEI